MFRAPVRSVVSVASWLALVLGLPGVVGCEDDKRARPADAGTVEAGPKQPVLDGELAAAVAAASASAIPASPGAAGTATPPESGVFAPGKADALRARGAPSKIEVLGEGSDPKVSLAPKLDGGEHKTTIRVGLRNGSQLLPTIEYGLVLKVDKPDKGKDDADAAVARVVCKVTSASLAPVQGGAMPKELATEVAKLKGSVIRYKIAKVDGAVSEYTSELAKGADPGLATLLNALVDALSTFTVPVPSKPVGAGAYWMVADRSASAGVDVVRYRVFRVQKVDKKVSLSVEVRQYAADDKVDVASAPKNVNLSIDAFESQGKGSVELSPGALVPGTGEVAEKIQARLKVAGQGDKRAMMQIDFSAKIGDQKPGSDVNPDD